MSISYHFYTFYRYSSCIKSVGETHNSVIAAGVRSVALDITGDFYIVNSGSRCVAASVRKKNDRKFVHLLCRAYDGSHQRRGFANCSYSGSCYAKRLATAAGREAINRVERYRRSAAVSEFIFVITAHK